MASPILTSGCGICGQQKNLQQCPGCETMLYCGPDHESIHSQKHKATCKAIQRKRTAIERHEQKLINNRVEGNYFTLYAGKFWAHHETRPYMRARFALVEDMGRIKSVESVKRQLDHFMDMLRLSRSDGVGARQNVPALLLRLNRDQECYDFIRWWTWARHYLVTDWDREHYEKNRGANVVESIEPFLKPGAVSSAIHAVPLRLFKIKLLLDRLEQMRSIPSAAKLPRAIFDRIQMFACPVTAANPSQLSDEGRRAAIEKLKIQIDKLFSAAARHDTDIWSALLDPQRYMNAAALAKADPWKAPGYEMTTDTLKANISAVNEIPGVLEFLKTKATCLESAENTTEMPEAQQRGNTTHPIPSSLGKRKAERNGPGPRQIPRLS